MEELADQKWDIRVWTRGSIPPPLLLHGFPPICQRARMCKGQVSVCNGVRIFELKNFDSEKGEIEIQQVIEKDNVQFGFFTLKPEMLCVLEYTNYWFFLLKKRRNRKYTVNLDRKFVTVETSCSKTCNDKKTFQKLTIQNSQFFL